MSRYKGNKIISFDNESATIEILLDDKSINTIKVLKRQIPKFHLVKIGLYLRTPEHAMYDVIDEDGNFVTH